MGYGTFRVRRGVPRRYYSRVASSFSRLMESTFVRKAAACFLVFIFVFFTSRVPVWPATRLTGFFRWAFTSDSDLTTVIAIIRRAAEGVYSSGMWALPVSGPAGIKMVWPSDGKILTMYGWTIDPETKLENLHEGIDIGAPEASPVRAAAAGVVVNVRDSAAYGKVVEIDHGRGLRTAYYNCSGVSAMPRARVEQGDTIARVASPAAGGRPHLHFEIIVDGDRVDPLKYLPAL